MVSYAVEQAYSSILMKNKFPFFVLNIDLNPQLVDANVHPAKMDVRFVDESYLSRAIYMAVSKALSSDHLFNPVAVPAKDRELFKFKTDKQNEYIQEQLYKQTNSADKTSESTKFVQNTQYVQSQLPNSSEKDIKQRDTEEHGIQQKYIEQKDVLQEDLEQNGIEPKDIEQNDIAQKDVMQKSVEQKYIEQKEKNYKDTEQKDIKQNGQVQTKNTGSTIMQEKTASVNNFSNNSTNNFTNNSLDKSEEIRIFTKALEPLARTDLKNESVIVKNVCSEEYISGNYEDADNLYCANSDVEPIYENTSLELANMKYIGQAFLTYILLQNGEELVMVDQHAAHERILYEKLKVKYDSQDNTTQLLLEPVVIQMQAFEFDTFRSNIELFNKIGFVFEDFGNNAIIIRGIPYLLDGYSPKDIFLELADKIQESVKPINTPIADDMIHMIACKAAIKANKRLDDKEVHQLLIELANTGRRYTCPHGRPTVVRLTKYEIEKMFKRII
jgi:DNA mismatch repair ATPase MutL